MAPGQSMAASSAALEPLEQELTRLLMSDAVRSYLRSSCAPLGASPPVTAPAELTAAGAIIGRLQQVIRDLPAEALHAMAEEPPTPSPAHAHRPAARRSFG